MAANTYRETSFRFQTGEKENTSLPKVPVSLTPLIDSSWVPHPCGQGFARLPNGPHPQPGSHRAEETLLEACGLLAVDHNGSLRKMREG